MFRGFSSLSPSPPCNTAELNCPIGALLLLVSPVHFEGWQQIVAESVPFELYSKRGESIFRRSMLNQHWTIEIESNLRGFLNIFSDLLNEFTANRASEIRFFPKSGVCWFNILVRNLITISSATFRDPITALSVGAAGYSRRFRWFGFSSEFSRGINNSFRSQNRWLDLELTTIGVQNDQHDLVVPKSSTPGRKIKYKKSSSKHSLEVPSPVGQTGHLEDFSDVG